MLVKLKDIVTFINGRAYLMPEIQRTGKYRIVRVGNFSGKDEWFYSDMELEPDKYCTKGDLLYKWACNFGPEVWKEEKVIYHYHIWKIIVDETKANKLYLYYLLKVMTPYWLSSTNGSTMIHITKEIMEDKLIELPSLKSQNKIASILSSIDAQIECNNAMVKRLQVLAHNSFDYFLKDNNDSNFVILQDIVIEKEKSTIQVNNIKDGSGNIPFFTSGEAILYTSDALTNGFNIYLSTGGNAKVQAYYGDASYSTDTWCISAKKDLQYYLFGYLKHIETQMDGLYFHGTGLKHLQKPLFLKSHLNIPDDISLKNYNAIVEPIHRQISQIERSTVDLQKLKNQLLPLLINQQLV